MNVNWRLSQLPGPKTLVKMDQNTSTMNKYLHNLKTTLQPKPLFQNLSDPPFSFVWHAVSGARTYKRPGFRLNDTLRMALGRSTSMALSQATSRRIMVNLRVQKP